MPWDTAVVSLERNHSSGFADAYVDLLDDISGFCRYAATNVDRR
jgi:hypothetical protein